MTLHAPTVSAIRKAIAERMPADDECYQHAYEEALNLIDTLELAEMVSGDGKLLPPDLHQVIAVHQGPDIDRLSGPTWEMLKWMESVEKRLQARK